MLYYEQQERDILNIFNKVQNDLISLDELRAFYDETKRKNLEYGFSIQTGDEENFFRYEKYWILLIEILKQNVVNKEEIKYIVLKIKAEDFILRMKKELKIKSAKKVDMSRKKTVYFDNNTFIYLKKNVPIEKINSGNDFQFVYSPAHLEELANSIRDDGFQFNISIENDLKYLSDLTNNIVFLPDLQSGIVVCEESPVFSFERVIASFDGTELSETLEKNFLENRKNIKEAENIKIRGSSIDGVLKSSVAEKILKNTKWYGDYEKAESKEIFWKEHCTNHEFLFTLLPGILNILELLDNNPEPSKKYRSHLHDTTHMIYATKSDVFVTSDKRLHSKSNEIFSFLGVDTKVVKYEDFCETFLLQADSLPD